MANFTEQCQNGHPMAQGAAFCESCGSPRPVYAPALHAFCINGHPLAPGSGFCTMCGASATQSFGTPVTGQPFAYQGAPHPTNYGYQYPVAPGRSTNGMAIASLVLGIVWIYWVGSVLAVIFGFVALKQTAERNEGGRGMATAGVVLGFVGIAILIILIIAGAIFASNNDFNTGTIFPGAVSGF